MKDHNYKEVGFKCGLEIHQQLDTAKLYCACPSLVRDPNTHINTITRRLRPVIGETGQVDAAAAHEASKSKLFVYEFRDTSSCLVEIDEEPPRPMNAEALGVVLQVAKLLNATIVDEIQVMRKIVVDGSNVTGFQRTALVAVDGFIETSKGRVGVPTICIEEESAQKLETGKEYVRYRLDRLGVPLIEIATDASIQDPLHAQECAKKLGMMLRSTGKVKRGIGSIRQDVNVSVKGGNRVEIKGFQDLKSIPKVVNYEIDRQLNLIKKKKPVVSEVRKAEPDFTTSFLRPMPGAARMYPETDVVPVRVTPELLSGIESVELISDIVEQLVKNFKIPKEIAQTLAKQGRAQFFETACSQYTSLKPSFIADLLLSAEKQVKKEFNVDISPGLEDYDLILSSLHKQTIAKESIFAILSRNKPVKEVISDYALMDDATLKKELQSIVSQHKGLPVNALIGKAMGKLRGKASGKKIVELLKTLV